MRATGSSSSSDSTPPSSPKVVYSQHTHSESKAWKDVKKAGNAPLVYVARGSHANYFGAGSHWTGVWWDRADGKGPQITPTLEVVEDTTPWMLLARPLGRHQGHELAGRLDGARTAPAAGRTG